MKKKNLNFNLSFSLRFCVVATLLLLAFTGCESDSDDLLLEEESISEQHLSANDGIFDGANGGMEGFYFLPPMVNAPTYSGTFDTGLSPVVEICETTECLTLHASFSMDEGDGSQLVRLDQEDEHYIVNWHTDQTGTEIGQTYRIRVSVAGTILGHADVQMAANGKDARNITDGEAIALIDGRTLPVKFRIEEGAVYVIGSEGGTFSSTDGLMTLEIPGGAIDEEIGITVEPASDPSMDEKMVPGLAFEFGPSGIQFAEPVIVTIKYDPATLPSGIDEELLSIRKYLNGDWVNIEGSTVDIINNTVRATLNSFSIYGVGERELYPIPELTGVDGFIHRISESDSRYRVSFAVDGVPTGGVYCCPSTLAAAQNAYPDRNLVYLPEATDDDIDTGIVPPLIGIDGYIELMDDGSGRYKISFAIDGFPTGGAACCPSSLEVARSWYPDRNFIFLSPSTEVNDLSWHSMGSGMNSYIGDLAVYNDFLIAGGNFTSAGGTLVNRIARWTGSAWQPLGEGLNSQVRSLTIYGDDLIVGGQFSTAGGQSAPGIARWDGTQWHAMGALTGGLVWTLTVYKGELIAGGSFSTADGQTVNRIARWDGEAWHSMDGGMDNTVFDLAVYNGELIAGGLFTTAGGQNISRIARWDGESWQPVGTGMNAQVLALTIHDGDLIAGGAFTNAGGQTVDRVARWDGTQWHSIGNGLNGWVNMLTVADGELVVGGAFTTAGGQPAGRIAYLDGSAWKPFGSGVDGRVLAGTVYENNLIIGGDFIVADGETANRIARWGTP